VICCPTLIDDAIAGTDPRTIVSLYSAPKDADPFAEATIRLANPSYDTLMNSASCWPWPLPPVGFRRVRRLTAATV